MNPLNLFRKKQPPRYGLDHAILNIEFPPPTMWMNMGYWEKEETLPEASRALLDQVLISAGFLNSGHDDGDDASDQKDHEKSDIEPIHLIDVGFGCGDQTLYLTKHFPDLLASYTGITMVPSQTELAAKRLAKDNTMSPALKETGVHLFTADASKPSSWEGKIHQAIASTTTASPKSTTTKNNPPNQSPETWILALDTLYHFQPSRLPFLTHAKQSLRASLMGFDLILSSSASIWEKFLLRILCWVSGIPFGNFLTVDEYIALFVRAGYDREMVEVRDVSEYVFGGLAAFIYSRDKVLKEFGLNGVGRAKIPARVFWWWARTGLVRGAIVTART